ncbi:hypothetical protein [Polymorphobacter sp.]|uniref:hypothetical protein n=1 Tax=Polymorphobacter sp. TaxID=1909290 RepID=UPI003F6F8B1F
MRANPRAPASVPASIPATPAPSCSPALPWLLLAAGLLLAPALINGTIFLFPDSIGYFHAGEASLKTVARLLSPPADPAGPAAAPMLAREAEDGISTSRSVYYGVPFVLLYRLGGEWALALVQTGIVLVALAAALPRMAVPRRLQPWVLAGAVLTGLGLFTTVAMPDLFAGLAVLALAMLLPHAQMSPRERWLWALLLLAACMTHKGILAMAAALLGLYVFWHLVTDRRWNRLPLPLLALAIAAAGHAAVNYAVEKIAGQPLVQTPFALARIVGDGTAERYLADHCPTAAAADRYVLCDHLDRFPMTENTFLWSHDPAKGIMNALPVAEREAISAESGRLVIAAVTAHPLHQIGASLRNLVAQFSLVGVTEYALGPRPGPGASRAMAGVLDRYADSPARHRPGLFDTASLIMTATYLASLAVLIIALARLPGTGWRRQPVVEIIAWLLLGLIVNAAVCGVIGGVFDRYQGRMAWLMPLAAVAAVALARRLRGGMRA